MKPLWAYGQLLIPILKKGVLFGDLIDVNPLGNKTGRKVKPATECLSIACLHAETNKPYWRCVAPECKHFQAGNRQQSRILLHALKCPYLSAKLKGFANDTAIAQNSLGAKVNPKEI